jgi:uncharacterized protein YabN with tetrapyrrole methylase and pyrophosphatase domain
VQDENSRKAGTLTVVGTGIKVLAQTTIEARAHIEKADKVLYLVADAATAYWISTLNATAEDLFVFYEEGKRRLQTYHDMVDRIMTCVREGANVCVALYGHPGVYAYPTHEAVRRARAEGYRATMQPGICTTDCLFADLGVDPGDCGCQMFEATDFLVRQRRFDPSCHLILWQIAVIGVVTYKKQMFNAQGLNTLIEVLAECYGAGHEVVVYSASQFPMCEPQIERVRLADLATARVSGISTLYVPPKKERRPDDPAMRARLGLGQDAHASILREQKVQAGSS